MTSATASYSIIGQRKLKVRADVIGAKRHNLRDKLLPNVDPDGPPPIVVQGDPDIWKGLNTRLIELKVRPRAGAVLGIEILFAASPEFWSTDAAERARQIATIEAKVEEYLADRFATEAVVSLVRHEDETSPHWHAVVAPIERKVDRRRKDATPIWQLNAAGLVGYKSDMAREHTRWAALLAPIGLKRGREHSGAKNKSNRVYRREMDAAIADARLTQAAASAELDDAVRERGDLASRLAALDAAQAEHEARVAAEEQRIAHRSAAMSEREAEAARGKRRPVGARGCAPSQSGAGIQVGDAGQAARRRSRAPRDSRRAPGAGLRQGRPAGRGHRCGHRRRAPSDPSGDRLR